MIVSYEGPANLKCSGEQGTFMALDTALTPELIEEGLARDFNRLVQDQRKAMSLEISDRIVVGYSRRRGSRKRFGRTKPICATNCSRSGWNRAGPRRGRGWC